MERKVVMRLVRTRIGEMRIRSGEADSGGSCCVNKLDVSCCGAGSWCNSGRCIVEYICNGKLHSHVTCDEGKAADDTLRNKMKMGEIWWNS
jgi:hypothetical protein